MAKIFRMFWLVALSLASSATVTSARDSAAVHAATITKVEELKDDGGALRYLVTAQVTATRYGNARKELTLLTTVDPTTALDGGILVATPSTQPQSAPASDTAVLAHPYYPVLLWWMLIDETSDGILPTRGGVEVIDTGKGIVVDRVVETIAGSDYFDGEATDDPEAIAQAMADTYDDMMQTMPQLENLINALAGNGANRADINVAVLRVIMSAYEDCRELYTSAAEIEECVGDDPMVSILLGGGGIVEKFPLRGSYHSNVRLLAN